MKGVGVGLMLLAAVALLGGCATSPASKVHYTVRQAPNALSLEQIVLLPVDIDVYEMSAGGVREEVPEWSDAAKTNVRSALLLSKGRAGQCCVSREVDTSSLTPEERDVLEEHLALFNSVAGSALWADLPANTAWHFKAEEFDYTLGNGLAFLKNRYGIDAGLIITGHDVVSTPGRKTTAVVGALFGVVVPLGHSMLIGGLVEFETGNLLWLNHAISAGNVDLRERESTLKLARELMAGFPAAAGSAARSPAPDN